MILWIYDQVTKSSQIVGSAHKISKRGLPTTIKNKSLIHNYRRNDLTNYNKVVAISPWSSEEKIDFDQIQEL